MMMSANRQSIKKMILLVLILFPLTIFLSKHAHANKQIDLYLPYEIISESVSRKLSLALKEASLDNIRVKNIQHWQQYQQAVRHAKAGIYLSPPHFSAWLKNVHKFNIVAKLKGPLRYVIVSESSQSNIFEIRDLINQKICTQRPLNLDYLLISQTFSSHVKSATPHIINSVEGEMNNDHSVCAAFSISEFSFKKLSNKYPNKYIRLSQGPLYANYALLADPSISEEDRAKFKTFLSQKKVQEILAPLLDRFTQDLEWVTSKNDDYPQEDAGALTRYWSK